MQTWIRCRICLLPVPTGSGKSVCINDIILSFIYGKKPEEVRLIMVDPKQVELRVYAPMPHLLMPVVTDPKKAAGALKWAVMEMDQRYKKMSKVNARSISRYNELQEDPTEKLPRLVIIIDELADLMMVAAKEVEESICRIAQLGPRGGNSLNSGYTASFYRHNYRTYKGQHTKPHRAGGFLRCRFQSHNGLWRR